MRNLCIIPARGGSKRIPRKNIKPFLGKPIIAYSIEAALNAGIFDEIMVSTDDAEIASIAKQYGADVPFFRSEKTANDYATLADVIKEVIEEFGVRGQLFDNVCCILATSPMVQSSDLITGLDKLKNSRFTTIVPIVEFSYPILRSFRMNDDGEINYNWPEHAKTRSQDLAPSYHDSGTFYWYKIQPWIEGTVIRGAVVVGEETVQDIDTDHDWDIAELKYRLMFEKQCI